CEYQNLPPRASAHIDEFGLIAAPHRPYRYDRSPSPLLGKHNIHNRAPTSQFSGYVHRYRLGPKEKQVRRLVRLRSDNTPGITLGDNRQLSPHHTLHTTPVTTLIFN